MRVLAQYGNPEVVVISNSRPIFPPVVSSGEGQYPTPEQIGSVLQQLSKKAWLVNATDIALEMGAPILANIVMMGTLVGTGLLPVGPEAFETELAESLSRERLDANIKAFRRGLAEVSALTQQ